MKKIDIHFFYQWALKILLFILFLLEIIDNIFINSCFTSVLLQILIRSYSKINLFLSISFSYKIRYFELYSYHYSYFFNCFYIIWKILPRRNSSYFVAYTYQSNHTKAIDISEMFMALWLRLFSSILAVSVHGN